MTEIFWTVVVLSILLYYAFADTSPRGHRRAWWTVVFALLIISALEATL